MANEQNQNGVDLMDEKDWLTQEKLMERYGFQGILQYVEDELERGKEMCEVNEEPEDRKNYSTLKNKVRVLILEFQKLHVS